MTQGHPHRDGSKWICKHCGGDRFSAMVTARGSMRGDVAVKDGKPYFDGGFSRYDQDFDDIDEEGYACDGCGAEEFKFEKLVVVKRAEDQLRNPCGRCDHFVSDHPLPDRGPAKYPDYYTRPAMPCTVEGCDCHDYYDLALANAGVTLEVAA